MKHHLSAFALMILAAGCATGGSRTIEPIVWIPGSYRLEATVSHETVNGLQRNTHRAYLTITPQGFMEFETDDALCEDPTPVQAERDLRNRGRSFRCGDASYWIEPTEDGVWGQVTATAQVERRVEECRGTGADRMCYERTITDTSRETERLLVTREDR